MRRPDLDRLAGFVRLREVQARDAETKAARAVADSRAQCALAKSAAARLADYRSGWEERTTSGRYDHEAARRWADACQSGEATLNEQILAVESARKREECLRQDWHGATMRAEHAEQHHDEARRIASRRRDEADVQRSAERHAQGKTRIAR